MKQTLDTFACSRRREEAETTDTRKPSASSPRRLRVLGFLIATFALLPGIRAEELDATTQTKVDAKVKQVETLAADPVVIKSVKAQNSSMPADCAALDQDKWKTLGVLDPLVRGFSKNEAGTLLKSKKAADISEAFISAANGTKVAFLNKPTNWSHKGKPKHEVPMTGKTWQGAVEVDDSTGLRQVQVSVPVLDDGKPIGSLVVGLDLSKLKAE